MNKVLTGSKFDFVATHYCGDSIYHVTQYDQAELEKHIPDNLFEMTRDQIAPIVKSIMETMNVLWSSTNGFPTFHEKFGEYTGLSIRQDRIYMAGNGWSVEVFNGRYDDIQPAFGNRISAIMDDETMTKDEKIKAITDFCGPMASPIG